MIKIFKIDFYPHDWLLDTSRLKPEDRGIYIQILMLIYAKGGSIDNDAKWISGSCNCSSRQVESSISRLIQSGFIAISDGKISQKRAESELNIKRTFLEHSSKGGRISNENKRQLKENKGLACSEHDVSVRSSTTTTTSTTTPTIIKDTNVSKRGSRFNLDKIPLEWIEEAKKIKSNINAEMTFDEFRDYWIAKAGKDGLKADWLATWRTWIRNKNKYEQQKTNESTRPTRSGAITL